MTDRVETLLPIADDELVVGWRNSEWTGIAPFLEEDVAFSSIAQNEIGHARALYELVAEELGTTADELAYDRPRPLQPAPLDERGAPVLLERAVEGERVRVGAEVARGELVQRARVPDLVLRDRREGNVLLQEGRDPRPFGVPPAEDQLVVRELEQQPGTVAHDDGTVPARSRASFRRALIE